MTWTSISQIQAANWTATNALNLRPWYEHSISTRIMARGVSNGRLHTPVLAIACLCAHVTLAGRRKALERSRSRQYGIVLRSFSLERGVVINNYLRNARTSRRHQLTKSHVETSISRFLSSRVLKWQSYGRCTLALGSLPSVLGSMLAMDKPMMSPKCWQISYFVILSSLENWSVRGRDLRSPESRYLIATSREQYQRRHSFPSRHWQSKV